jgi:hypothetical protein
MADEAIRADGGHSSIVVQGTIEEALLEVRTLAVGGATAKVGMVMTGAGETHPAIDIHADGDETFLGLLLRPVVRPSDTWTIDTALADAQEVVIMRPHGGRLKVAIIITGMTGAVAYKAGDPVYIQDYTANTLASANPTLGAAMAVQTGIDVFVDTTADLTHPLPVIGHLAHDVASGGDATSAVAGRVVHIWY